MQAFTGLRKTGYDASKKGRLPDLLNVWSAKRLKEAGADAVKFLLYYDIDEEAEINDQKHAFIERPAQNVQQKISHFIWNWFRTMQQMPMPAAKSMRR